MSNKKYTEEEIKELFVKVAHSELPSDFDDWNLPYPDGSGLTIAHEAAYQDRLPKNFGKDDPKLWAIASKLGWMVAHVAAEYSTLPKDFGKDHPELWALRDMSGKSVSHVAAHHNNLPEDFGKDDPKLWEIYDEDVTVLEVYISKKGHCPKGYKVKLEKI